MEALCEEKWCEVIEGIPFPLQTTMEKLNRIRNLELKPDDILITAYPKCGNNWLKYIVMLMIYEGDEKRIGEYPYSCPNLFISDLHYFENIDIRRRCNMTSLPRYFPKQLNDQKGQHIIMLRNPKDVAISKFSFELKRIPQLTYEIQGISVKYKRTLDEYLDDFIDGKTLWGSYFNYLCEMYQLIRDNPDKYLLLRYEEMRQTPLEHTKIIAQFLGYSYSDDLLNKIVQISDYDYMKKNCYGGVANPIAGIGRNEFFKSGKIGGWRSSLTPNQSEKFDKAIVEKLGHLPDGFNYKECLGAPLGQTSSEV